MSCLTNKSTTLPYSICEDDGLDWRQLLRRDATVIDPSAVAEPFEGKRILITGAGGWIGSAIAKVLARFHPEHLVLLDSAEHGLYEIHNDLGALAGGASHTTALADVCDAASLRELFSIYRPQIVIHAAAYKHVPLMEHHPLAALRNNALGTYTLAQVSLQWGVEQFVMLSTDKAVSPSSIMGASKRVAELILVALNSGSTRMKALRLANVLGSRGSVVPLFKKQIAAGGPVTVTDPEVRRYFLSLRESVALLASLASREYSSGIYVPDLGEPVRILELAHFLIHQLAPSSSHDIPMVFTGLRPGDKMTEALFSGDEVIHGAIAQPLCAVHALHPETVGLLQNIEQLQQCVSQRATGKALEIVKHLVPDYQPSELVRRRFANPVMSL